VPQVLATIHVLFPDAARSRDFAVFGITLGLGGAAGVALGGWLVTLDPVGLGWRSVFLVNLPVGLAALAVVFAARRGALARDDGPACLARDAGDRAARLDISGLLLLGAGLGLATYGASQGPARGWLSAGSGPAWAGGLALVVCYVLRERAAARWTGGRSGPGQPGATAGARPPRGSARRRSGPPAVNLGLLGDPARALTLALACVASVVLFAVLFLAPVFLQQIQHHSSTLTGLVLLPQGVVMGLASWLGSVLIERGKARPWVITASVSGGLALLAASTLGLLALTAATPVWVTAALLCGRGVALGLTVQPLVVALLGGLPASAMPDANTLFNMAERLSGSFGIALLATLYASRAAATGSPVTALRDCALVLAAASAAAAIAALALRRPHPSP
jgi:predicted MFS family arabinose efflux permease